MLLEMVQKHPDLPDEYRDPALAWVYEWKTQSTEESEADESDGEDDDSDGEDDDSDKDKDEKDDDPGKRFSLIIISLDIESMVVEKPKEKGWTRYSPNWRSPRVSVALDIGQVHY